MFSDLLNFFKVSNQMSSFVVRTSNIHPQQQQSQQIGQQRYTTVVAGQNQHQQQPNQSYNTNNNYSNQYNSIGVSVTTSTPASISNLTTNQTNRSSPSIQYSAGGFYRAGNTG